MALPYSNPNKKKKTQIYICSYCDTVFDDLNKLLQHEETCEEDSSREMAEESDEIKKEINPQNRKLPYNYD